jgi:hypothetical protein
MQLQIQAQVTILSSVFLNIVIVKLENDSYFWVEKSPELFCKLQVVIGLPLKGPHFVSRHPMCYIPGCQVKVLYIGWLL